MYHDDAVRYIGGLPEEYLYDQTKLVVINERYRELELNQQFAQFATSAGFNIRVCEGYDPESKGKVEAGVKYFRSEEHTSELQSRGHLVCRLLLEKKKQKETTQYNRR